MVGSRARSACGRGGSPGIPHGIVNATFVSLIASCQLHDLDPFAYLRDLFCLLPGWNAPDVLELAPSKWKATSARPDVQKQLAENIYRRVSVAP